MKIKFLIAGLLPLLAGCASHKSRRLKSLIPKPVHHHENISFAAKAYNSTDCIAYLGRNVIAAGYTPIQLAIKNESQRYLQFATDEINIKTMPPCIVAESVYFSVRNRALGYGIPGIFIWPFLIPAVIDSLGAAEANEHLLRDYIAKTVQDKTIIPDSDLDGLIFVSNNDYKNKLKVTLTDKDSKEKITCKAFLTD